uniref:Ovule protein n=1 Tax=Strongyloides venezuelensis TaxID=75913 RepID=A0A0K0G5F9_STRVS
MLHRKNLPDEKYIYLPISPASYCTLPRARLKNESINYSSNLYSKDCKIPLSKPPTHLRRNYVAHSEYTPHMNRNIMIGTKIKDYEPKLVKRNMSLVNSVYFPSR